MNEEIKEIRSNPEKAQCFFSKILAFTLGPVELKELSEENEVKIIDVRARADYEIGHIPMAISIPYEEMKERLDELQKDDLHVVYCYNNCCHLGAKAAYLLAKNNFSVMELTGGFKSWSEDFRFTTTK